MIWPYYRTKQKGWKKPLLAIAAVGLMVSLACIGQMKIREGTGGKPIEVWALHEVAGRNYIERQHEEEKQVLSFDLEQIKQEKQELELENKKYLNIVSRGNASREIVDFEKLPGPIYLLELTQRMCEQHGFKSMGEIYSIICYESKYDPACHNTRGEDSRGLLQVNVADPSHKKRNPNKNKLFDPAYNLSYQLPELYDYYILGQRKGLSGAALAKFISRYGQRPQWSESIAKQIDKSYKDFLNARIKEAR